MGNGSMIISICSAVYNQELFVKQCLDGVVRQRSTYPFELLIHDDASTDGTADIIREYEKMHPDIIKPIYQTENQYSQGIKISLTHNYPRARGKYIAFCEGDDVQLTNGVIIETHHHTFHSNYQASRADIRPSTLNIGGGAVIGSRAIILDSCNYIGKYARVGAGAVVTKDVPDYATVVSIPAKVIKINNKT